MNRLVAFIDGTKVCPLGLGTWHMGEDTTRRNAEIAALRRGVEMGLEVVDTAEMYENEELVGEALKGLRDKVFLVGKVLPYNADFSGTLAACEQTLRKLRTDHLDLYLLHWSGRYPIEETVRAMDRLISDGKIRMWGVSNMDVAEMEEFFSFSEGRNCATDQVLYNLAHRGIEYDLMPWCEDRGMPIMAYSPILQGELLSNSVLKQIANSRGATPSQIALAWTMRSGNVVSIPKSGDEKHVIENYKALEIDLTAEELKILDKYFPAPTRKHPLDMI